MKVFYFIFLMLIVTNTAKAQNLGSNTTQDTLFLMLPIGANSSPERIFISSDKKYLKSIKVVYLYFHKNLYMYN